MEFLVEGLGRFGNEECAEWGLKGIHQIFHWSSPEDRLEGMAGGMGTVVEVTRNHLANRIVAFKGCSMICCLSYSFPSRSDRLLEVGACEVIVAALRTYSDDCEVCRFACWAICCLIDNSTFHGAKSLLIQEGAEEAVRNCCENGSKSNALSKLRG